MVPPPLFTTNRLFLKPIEEKHAPSYQKHFDDYEVIQHLSIHVPWPFPSNGVATYLQSVILPQQGICRWSWGLFLKSAPDDMIGGIELWRKGQPENRGFWLGRAYWGQGLMTEAAFPVTAYAFTTLGFDRLILNNAIGNARSRRLKEKAGAKLLSIEPAQFVNPTYTHQELWELTRESWMLTNSTPNTI